MGAPDLLRRPLADKFLYRALVLVNAYKCAKFQLPSSISYGGGSQNKKGELLIFQTLPSGQFFKVAIVPANTYRCTKFQLSSSISFGYMRGPK